VVKASLIAMLVLTVLIAMGLRWREQRVPLVKRGNMVARGKRTINRWVTAARIGSAICGLRSSAPRAANRRCCFIAKRRCR